MQVNEFFNASLDENCKDISSYSCLNYNYFTDLGATLTITADKDSTDKVFKLTDLGISLGKASNYQVVKVTTVLSPNILYSSGDGSKTNPYIFK